MQFEVIISTGGLIEYLKEKKVTQDGISFIMTAFPIYAGLKCLQPEELFWIAEGVMGNMDYDKINELREEYGTGDWEQLVIHIADEILAFCCRTVLQ